jgi:hypothetical protein
MDPECLHCGESYSISDGQEPTTFCDRCAHNIAEYALNLCMIPDVENRCGAWRDVNEGVRLLCKETKAPERT